MRKPNHDNEYNDESVHYCKRCLSLAIKTTVSGYDYCEDCGSTNIEETDINTWESMYENMNGIKFLDKKNPNKKKLL